MIKVSLEVTDGATTRRVRITAQSIARAIAMAGGEVPGRTVRVLFPIEPKEFFAGQAPATPVTSKPGAA
jgi:hypothetical protein